MRSGIFSRKRETENRGVYFRVNPLQASRHSWTVLTLGVGLLGGVAADQAGIPLGWLLGSLLASAALCCACPAARVPQPWRYTGQSAVGLSAGLAFTPQLVSHVFGYAPLIVMAVLASVAMGIALSGVLVRFAGVDRTTAYFASLPGGVAEMANLAERNGGDVAAVAVSQTLRVFLAVLTMPLLARGLSPAGPVATTIEGHVLTIAAFGGLSFVAALAGWVLAGRRVPNAWLLGGMAAGLCAALTIGDRLHVPSVVLSVAQILIGASLGARLGGPALRRQRRLVPVTVITTVLLLLGNIAIGGVLAILTATGTITALLATAPGGLAEMSLTAVALKADVSLVIAFHLVRTLVVATMSVPLYAMIAGRDANASEKKEVT